mmetsp:Transcript_13532/g.29982  ORF Transcript_13532/g.29982 Transcript_13532/m.29982 type:complete len:279 (-) Transcript_13532:562-1398(-)
MATAEEKEGEATADAAASKMVSTETDAVVPEALAPPAVAAAKDHDGDDDNENDGADDADDNLSADLFGEDAEDDDDGADAAPAPPDKAEEEADGNDAISSSSNQQDATTNTTTASSSLLSPSSEAATSAIGSPTTASSGSETFSIPKKQHSNANANANGSDDKTKKEGEEGSATSSTSNGKPEGRKRLYVMTLAVLAAYRGRGVGRALVKSVLDHVEENIDTPKFRDVDEVLLHVQTSNDGAMRFYVDGFGFDKGPMVENYYRRIDPPHCYVLSKKLR